jgi:hypothetical protein
MRLSLPAPRACIAISLHQHPDVGVFLLRHHERLTARCRIVPSCRCSWFMLLSELEMRLIQVAQALNFVSKWLSQTVMLIQMARALNLRERKWLSLTVITKCCTCLCCLNLYIKC